MSEQKTVVIAAHTERIRQLIPLIQILADNNYQIITIFRWKSSKRSDEKALKKIEENPVLIHNYPRLRLQQIKNVKIEYFGDHQPILLRLFKRYFVYRFRFFGFKPFFKLYMGIKYTNWGQRHFEKDFIKLFEHDFQKAKNILTSHLTKAIFLITDKYFGEGEMALAKAGRDLGIPILLPHTFYHGPSIAAFRNNPKFLPKHPLASRYQIDTFKKFSSEIYGQQQHENHFFYPAFLMNVLEKYHLLTKNPWYIGAGVSDLVLVDNRHTAERYTNNMTPSKKIRIVGEFFYDDLYRVLEKKEEIKSALCTKYGLDPAKKIVILSMPQLWEHNILSKEQHWIEIDFLMQTLAHYASSYSIMISLHPKSFRFNYEFLTEAFPCIILDEPLAEVLPIADLFTATFSSTVIWAVLCGIPSIVFDFYELNYTMYDYLDSVEIIRDKSELTSAYQRWLEGDAPDFTADWQTLSRHEVFDGKVLERYLNIINQL